MNPVPFYALKGALISPLVSSGAILLNVLVIMLPLSSFCSDLTSVFSAVFTFWCKSEVDFSGELLPSSFLSISMSEVWV